MWIILEAAVDPSVEKSIFKSVLVGFMKSWLTAGLWRYNKIDLTQWTWAIYNLKVRYRIFVQLWTVQQVAP